MRVLFFVLSLALCALPSAYASSSFGYSGKALDVQFVGSDFSPEFKGVIEVSTKAGARTLPRQTYTLSRYVFGKTLKLKFVNPGDASLPPSFTLTVRGEQATLKMGTQRFDGAFTWES